MQVAAKIAKARKLLAKDVARVTKDLAAKKITADYASKQRKAIALMTAELDKADKALKLLVRARASAHGGMMIAAEGGF